MGTLRSVLAVLAVWLFAGSALLRAEEAKPPLYIAMFRLTVGEDQQLREFQPVKVIDLLAGTNDAATVELPPEFINRARERIISEPLKPTIQDGKLTSVLTTFIYAPTEVKGAPPGVSFSALDGAFNVTSNFHLLGKDGQLSTFAAHLGRSAIFVTYYALPLPKTNREQREAIVEADVLRSAGNVGNAEMLTRKNLSTDTETIMEFTCKSPRNQALTIRSRYLCNERQLLGFAAVLRDDLPPEEVQALDRLFEGFRFR